jgi:predicted DNA-binding protein (MmcQ/YjbR family)
MTLAEFDSFCAALPHSTHVVQWGDASVWKIGGKVFAIGGWNETAELAVTFKCTPLSFAILKERPGLRPAPYLASRGLTWIQRVDSSSMDDPALKDYLVESRRLAAAGLARKRQTELGLAEPKGQAGARGKRP